MGEFTVISLFAILFNPHFPMQVSPQQQHHISWNQSLPRPPLSAIIVSFNKAPTSLMVITKVIFNGEISVQSYMYFTDPTSQPRATWQLHPLILGYLSPVIRKAGNLSLLLNVSVGKCLLGQRSGWHAIPFVFRTLFGNPLNWLPSGIFGDFTSNVKV